MFTERYSTETTAAVNSQRRASLVFRPPSHLASYPTGPFTSLATQNQEIGQFYTVQNVVRRILMHPSSNRVCRVARQVDNATWLTEHGLNTDEIDLRAFFIIQMLKEHSCNADVVAKDWTVFPPSIDPICLIRERVKCSLGWLVRDISSHQIEILCWHAQSSRVGDCIIYYEKGSQYLSC